MLMQKLVLVAPLIANAILYILMGLSVLSIGLIIERWWFFNRRKTDVAGLSDGLKKALRTHDVTTARKLLEQDPSVEAEIITEALGWYDEGAEAVEQIVAKSVRARRKKFEAGLVFLGTLGNNAPFIGLFGTVLGIVTAFKELGASTGSAGAASAGMNNVMSSISEALIATAVGILVALPAVIYYNIFQKKGSDIEENANGLGNVLLASLKATHKSGRRMTDEAAEETTEEVSGRLHAAAKVEA
jgi:biopolymer transport protein ExbB/biopolymer transport protein TolQ